MNQCSDSKSLLRVASAEDLSHLFHRRAFPPALSSFRRGISWKVILVEDLVPDLELGRWINRPEIRGQEAENGGYRDQDEEKRDGKPAPAARRGFGAHVSRHRHRRR